MSFAELPGTFAPPHRGGDEFGREAAGKDAAKDGLVHGAAAQERKSGKILHAPILARCPAAPEYEDSKQTFRQLCAGPQLWCVS
ncbi:hypothetical protein GCM10009688_14060 [Arthrobacter gandavensis]|uniref:Uncharacterized protein n=1 Tax=Arthrobacter gandavensis TaxID=169960 RepID=A0ABP5ADW3_9MICC